LYKLVVTMITKAFYMYGSDRLHYQTIII
jgi:hypothetical protein